MQPRYKHIRSVHSRPAVCDEGHVVFECPVLQHLGDKYSRLFSGLVRLCSGSCGSLTLLVWCIMSGTVCWCCWLMVRVAIGHLISPDVAGTDARVTQFIYSGL